MQLDAPPLLPKHLVGLLGRRARGSPSWTARTPASEPGLCATLRPPEVFGKRPTRFEGRKAGRDMHHASLVRVAPRVSHSLLPAEPSLSHHIELLPPPFAHVLSLEVSLPNTQAQEPAFPGKTPGCERCWESCFLCMWGALHHEKKKARGRRAISWISGVPPVGCSSEKHLVATPAAGWFDLVAGIEWRTRRPKCTRLGQS